MGARAQCAAVRVLVVEDEERLAAAIARGLVAEGFDVDLAHDGLDGLWRARELRYAAIVLDILLPGMNGYRVCQTLRDEGISTPILMLTAKNGEYDIADALDTGADDFLSKPFSFVVLVARLRALARRGDRPLRQSLVVGDLVLDSTTRECHRGDTPVALTGRELALLEALLRHAPHVATKASLLDDVWGAEFHGDPNIVEVYVRRLRDRIDRPFGRSSLRTVRGAGYQLVDDAPR
jgi:two-component system, OmpR family, response regulator